MAAGAACRGESLRVLHQRRIGHNASMRRPSSVSARSVISTPFGPLSAWWHRTDGLRVAWGRRVPRDAVRRALPATLLRRLAEAAKGAPVAFDDIPTPKGTGFQQRCWEIARRIPRGRTLTYGELAARAGSPGAARAAGQAMRRNPIPLIVPCHRVVASRGLGGYAGTDQGTSARCRLKASLLALERAAPDERR